MLGVYIRCDTILHRQKLDIQEFKVERSVCKDDSENLPCLALPCVFLHLQVSPRKITLHCTWDSLNTRKSFSRKRETAHFLRRGPRAFTGDCISPRMQMYLLYSEVLLKSGVKSEKNLRTAATCSESLEA